MNLFLKNFWKTIAWAVIIVILSCMPADNIQSQRWNILPHQDKILHLIFYGILSLFFIRAYQIHYKKAVLNSAVFIISLAFIVTFGMILEIIQEKFIQSRSGEIMDLVFDMIGLILSFGFLYLSRYLKNYSKNLKD